MDFMVCYHHCNVVKEFWVSLCAWVNLCVWVVKFVFRSNVWLICGQN
jgi:hypothetical protein